MAKTYMPSHDQSVPPTIAVVGVSSVDITIREAPDWMGHEGRDVYTPESLHALKAPVEMGLGGNGGAAAFVLGKLGLPVELYTSIGTDAPGQLIRQWLNQAGVRCIESNTAKSTMVALSAVNGQGLRVGCLKHPGEKVDWSLSASDTRATWLLLMVQSFATASELPEVQHTMQQFRRSDRMTVVDTGMGWIVDPVAPNRMHALWSSANIVLGTLDELSHWTAKQDPESIAGVVLEHGAEQVVVKMGANGAAYQSQVEPFTLQKAIPVRKPNRTIGAGDAFAGAMLASLAVGQPLSTAVTKAQHIAAQVVAAGRGVVAISTS